MELIDLRQHAADEMRMSRALPSQLACQQLRPTNQSVRWLSLKRLTQSADNDFARVSMRARVC